MKQYYKLITSEKPRLDTRLKELWQYRDLILLLTKRHFVVFYKQTILGPLWAIINPILSSLLYMIVFGNIAKISTDGVPQLLFYFTSTSIWSFFSSCVTQNADTFRANAHIFGKVYFPRLTVSVSNILSAMIQLGLQMILVLVLGIYYTVNGMLSPRWELFPLIIPLLMGTGLLGMGVGVIISSLTTKYRDLSILVSFGVSLWMYATPIVYPISSIAPGLLCTCIWLNPVSAPVELFRYILLGVGSVNIAALGYSVVMMLMIVWLGTAVFNRVEKNFMDTI